MTTSEQFALYQWLEHYPDEATYSDILEMIENGSEDIFYIDLVAYEPPTSIIKHIEATKRQFEQYAQRFIQPFKDEICRLESALMDVPQ
jgi:hypothetical protein